jgi:anti-sigma regulatory factor (Ser/Thr protein kinase)
MDIMAPIRTTGQRPRRVFLTPGPAAAADARRHVRATIHASGVPIDAYVAVLLTSELVTNAIWHDANEDKSIQLVITWVGEQMRVEVHDTSPYEPVLTDTRPDSETGRGLMLVAELSTDWGFYRTDTGKAVYFTLAPEADHDEPTITTGGTNAGRLVASTPDAESSGSAELDGFSTPSPRYAAAAGRLPAGEADSSGNAEPDRFAAPSSRYAAAAGRLPADDPDSSGNAKPDRFAAPSPRYAAAAGCLAGDVYA